jgi:hypothetical protein
MASMTDRPPRRSEGFLPRLRRYIERLGPYQSPQPCRAPKAHRCGCSWRRPLDHRHSHDRRHLRRQPASRRAAIHDRKTQAAYAALVRPALGLVCRPSWQGCWAVSQGVKRKPGMSGVPCVRPPTCAHVPPAGGTGRSFFKTERTVNGSLRSRCSPQKSAYQLVGARLILQCVGQIKIGSSVQALYQPPRFRRHGKPNGIMPVLPSSPTSKSQSSGASWIGSHRRARHDIPESLKGACN